MSREIIAGSIVKDQVDFYTVPGSITRYVGLVASNVSLVAFVNNSLVTWPVLDGSNVSDFNVLPGNVYFNAIPGASGFYAIRYFASVTGYLRLVFTIPGQQDIKEYTLQSDSSRPPSGLTASFVP